MVAGFFDPLHQGHLDLFKYAKFGDYTKEDVQVVAVIHPTIDIVRKSGFYIYEYGELKDLLLGLPWIDKVEPAMDTDGLVSNSLKYIKPNYFVKGPDRNPTNMPKEELEVCEEIGCRVVYQPGIKMGNSSNIKDRIRRQLLARHTG